MVARWPKQYKHKPCRHRDLGDVVKQRGFLQANESIQRSRQAVHVANQYVGGFGTGWNFLEKVLVVLNNQSIDRSQSINQSMSLFRQADKNIWKKNRKAVQNTTISPG